MRDIPVFTTENGVATLYLKNVPVTKTAYIKIQDALNTAVFAQECCDFCRVAGAETVYCNLNVCCCDCVRIVSMLRPKTGIPETAAKLVPVETDTMELWRDIYNRKMKQIPNASQIMQYESQKYLESGNCYFVKKDSVLIGIGMTNENRIEALASVSKGAGKDVLLALCNSLQTDVIELTVAEENTKAVRLYETAGFAVKEILETWYKIF